MNDKRRSVGVFILICVVLLFLIIGGVRFMKSRDAAVTTHTPAAPTTEAPKQEEVKPQENSPSNTPTHIPAPVTSQAPTITTPAPLTNNSNSSSPQPSQTPSQVPVTGPSYVEFTITGVLITLAAYFTASLKHSRDTIKRMVLRY